MQINTDLTGLAGVTLAVLALLLRLPRVQALPLRQKAGVLLALDGLHPPSMGARVSFSGGKPKVSHGPFSETKDVLGGYWMIQVNSKEEAIEWASRCPASDNEVIEVRQVQEFSDFPADVQQAAAGFPDLQTHSQERRR